MGSRLVIPVLVILCALLLWTIHYRTEAFFVGATLLVYWCTLIIKLVVDRPRPPNLDTGTQSWYLIPGPAFPSGHVLHFVFLYGLLFYLVPTLIKNRRTRLALRVFLGSMILLVGPSVVYTGRHWPSDALGGYIVGGFFLAALIWGYNRWKDGKFDRWYETVRPNRRRPLTTRLNSWRSLRKRQG
ncbi:phosphatase PAP2 family protein [Chloroflexota bacterium]